ncbi:MAG: hypothetical protein IJB90_04045 [Clostridia bacterium]|nr:hypothetical protein [Clostridia bacterium]
MEEKILERKWFNYFNNMRNKYNMRLSANKPIIIFLDAKDASKKYINILKGNKNGFFDAMELTSKYFSTRYNCLSIWGTDEISFIIEDADMLINTINNEKNYRTHDIASVFSQYFFEYFNNIYEGENVYWHCKCFNISKEKIEAYIKFKSRGILKGITSFFLKQNGVRGAYGIKLEEKIEMCKKYKTYSLIEEYQNGVLQYKGDKIDLKEYLKGNIVVLERKNENVEFFDLIEFDKSI